MCAVPSFPCRTPLKSGLAAPRVARCEPLPAARGQMPGKPCPPFIGVEPRAALRRVRRFGHVLLHPTLSSEFLCGSRGKKGGSFVRNLVFLQVCDFCIRGDQHFLMLCPTHTALATCFSHPLGLLGLVEVGREEFSRFYFTKAENNLRERQSG